MVSPLGHYPPRADIAALWYELLTHYTGWRVRKLQHRAMLALESGDREIGKANSTLFCLDESGRLYKLRALDRISMLDTWCREARELLQRCKSLQDSLWLPRGACGALQHMEVTLSVAIFLADVTREAFESRL